MSTKTQQIVEELSKLSVLELAELKKALEEHWGVTAAAPAIMAAPSAAAGPAEAAEEPTAFQVTLESVPADKKIGAIKVVREATGLGLKEAKELVEGAPKVLKESVPKAEAEEMKKKFEEAGAKVSLKGL